jgi:hypothetical protein
MPDTRTKKGDHQVAFSEFVNRVEKLVPPPLAVNQTRKRDFSFRLVDRFGVVFLQVI